MGHDSVHPVTISAAHPTTFFQDFNQKTNVFFFFFFKNSATPSIFPENARTFKDLVNLVI